MTKAFNEKNLEAAIKEVKAKATELGIEKINVSGEEFIKGLETMKKWHAIPGKRMKLDIEKMDVPDSLREKRKLICSSGKEQE